MKHFVQKLTYDDGRVREIRRDYDEMLDFHNRLERNEIDGVRNFSRKSVFDFSFDRGKIHYDFYLDESSLNVSGIHN